jgi:MerR family redox-sensitive transcriptional activator SoxR
MTIGEIAKQSRVRASTIRYYEQLGLLPTPDRVSGQRRYDDGVLRRLAVIRFAKHVGFSLKEIGQLLQGPGVPPNPERWREMAHRKMRDLAEAIDQASALQRMLQDTLSQACPKLVERALALDRD